MQRSVSVRIEGLVEEQRREPASRMLTSLGGRAVSWRVRPDLHRTYALFTVPEGYDAAALAQAVGAQQVDDPALVVLEIFPRERERVAALGRALGGPGRPAGVVDVVCTEEAVAVACDPARTPLSLLIDLTDAELEHAPGRKIVQILPLDDAVLAAAASDLLGDPAIDVSRLIETYTESFS